MPFGTYEESVEKLYECSSCYERNELQWLSLKAVKKCPKQLNILLKAQFPSWVHIGLQPQSVLIDGGYKVERKSKI